MKFSSGPTLAALCVATGLTLTACASSPASESATMSVEEALENMTLQEKIGQLIVVAAEGSFMNEGSPAYRRLLRYVRDHHVGGIIWYGANVYDTAWVNHRLQSHSKVPLLISADLEAGVGMRFSGTTFWPWAMAVAATGDPSLAETQGMIVANEAKLIGINQIYAPVADVNNNPDNPVINVRSYGEDPREVARFVTAFIRGVQSEGVLATVKHFPGHGDTHTDSHRSLPELTVTRERLDEVELVPFRAAIEEGVASVMLAHLAIPAIDDRPLRGSPSPGDRNPYVTRPTTEVNAAATTPVSLSARFVDGLLREELGFGGLVVTDAMDMGGIIDHIGSGEAAVRTIEAGADQVLKPADAEAAIAALEQAVRGGRISMERLDASVRRILEAKQRSKPAPFDPERIFQGVDRPDHHAIALDIARQAITLVRDRSETLPLDRDAKVVELVVGDFADEASTLATFHSALSRGLSSPPPRFILERRSSANEIETARRASLEAETIVIAFTVRTRSGQGTVGVPPRILQLIRQLHEADKQIIAVSFGSPYTLREVPFLDTYIAAYGVQPVMQSAAASALFGENPISGRLPVTIPGIASRQSGLDRP